MGFQHPPVCVAETLTGQPGIVDVWLYFYESADGEALQTRHEALMTPDERARHERFHFERDRRQFVATRALVRTALSKYASVAPADWRFAAGSHGKPHVAQPATSPALFFNLANTQGLVICAVSAAHEMIGADVERMDRKTEILELAERFFSPFEAAALKALSATEQRRRFFTYWTLKESYIKARGLGLAIALDHFSFRLEGQNIGVRFEPALADDATRWRFALWTPRETHMIAVGADTGGAPLSLRVQHIVP